MASEVDLTLELTFLELLKRLDPAVQGHADQANEFAHRLAALTQAWAQDNHQIRSDAQMANVIRHDLEKHINVVENELEEWIASRRANGDLYM